MADEVVITARPVRVAAASKQDLRLCFDASDFDELDLLLFVTEGASVAVRLITNMQNQSENGWVQVATFSATSAVSATRAHFENFLRYVRWEVTSAGNATFTIRGVGRRWA